MLRVLLLLLLPGVMLAADPIFEEGAKLKVEAEKGVAGEGPAWDAKLGLLTSGNGHINRLDRDGKSTIHRKDAGTNGLLFDAEGRLLACEPVAKRVTRTDLDGKLTVLTDSFNGKKYNTPNDITVDSKGRIYFSDPRYGPRDGMEQKDSDGNTIEGVYRIDADGKVHRVIGREVDRANGVLVSADDKFLFVADNNNDTKGGARKLWRFDLKDGEVDLKSKTLLYDWKQGRGPDGLKQDKVGRLYVAAGLNKASPPHETDEAKAGVYVLSPTDGKLLAFIAVPTDEVTNCAFGGDDLKTLYITGGGVLYSIRTTEAGRVVWTGKTEKATTTWKQFAGPTGDFRTPAKIATVLEKSAVLWRVPIGLGESSIIGDGNRLFCMSGERDKSDATKGIERVIALDPKNGEIVWEHKTTLTGLPKGDTPMKGGKSGPQASPCIIGGCVITIGYTGHISALDAKTGKLLWEKELIADFGGESPEFGFASSPVALGELVLIPVGGKKTALVALDPKNGAEKWRTEPERASCCTPQVVTICGVEQIIHTTRSQLNGYSVSDGKTLWTYKLPLAGQTNVPSPMVLSEDRIVISGQGVKGMRLLKLTKTGESFAAKEVWKSKVELFYCNAVVLGDTLYGATSDEFGAISLKDGEIIWTNKMWKNSNTLLVDGEPLVLRGDGRLARCELGTDGLKDSSGFPACGRAWTPPSIIGHQLYLRDNKEIVCVSLQGR